MKKSGQIWKVGLIQLAVIGGLILMPASIHSVGAPRDVHAEQSGPFASLMVDPSLGTLQPDGASGQVDSKCKVRTPCMLSCAGSFPIFRFGSRR